jgi:hypothetical protein
MNMRLAGQGDAGEKGGPNGHLYVHVKVAEDPFFQRKGSDVYIDVRLGRWLSVSLCVRLALPVPAGSYHGSPGCSGCHHQHSHVEG